jgi:type IV pilus assembly protein PilC
MMLIKVSGHYEQEVDEMAERLSKLVEPVLLVFLGGFIGFILVSILMPMFRVFTNIG